MFLLAYISVCHVYTVTSEMRRGCWIPLNWSYRWLCATMLGIEHVLCKCGYALNHLFISPVSAFLSLRQSISSLSLYKDYAYKHIKSWICIECLSKG